MKKHGIITLIFVSLTLAASFIGGYAVNAITKVRVESQERATCSDQLRQAMDDMHSR
jgi:hypothetical protein